MWWHKKKRFLTIIKFNRESKASRAKLWILVSRFSPFRDNTLHFVIGVYIDFQLKAWTHPLMQFYNLQQTMWSGGSLTGLSAAGCGCCDRLLLPYRTFNHTFFFFLINLKFGLCLFCCEDHWHDRTTVRDSIIIHYSNWLLALWIGPFVFSLREKKKLCF